MKRPGRYPDEVRERAVRMVFSQQAEYDSPRAAICSISEKLGMTTETVRRWVRQAETDEGRRAGLSTDDRERLKALERGNRELRRANKILKSAAASFGTELDPAGNMSGRLAIGHGSGQELALFFPKTVKSWLSY